MIVTRCLLFVGVSSLAILHSGFHQHEPVDTELTLAMVELVRDVEAQEELQLSEIQTEDCVRSLEKSMSEWNSQVQVIRGRYGIGTFETQEFQSKLSQLRESYARQMLGVLQRHLSKSQMKRLKQLVYWSSINQRGGPSTLFANEMIQQELGISDERRQTLERKALEIEEEFNEEVELVRRKYRRRFLNELEQDQREKLREVLGTSSDIHSSKPIF